MNCKHCQAELPEETTLCPACGGENLPQEEPILPTAEEAIFQEAPAEEAAAEEAAAEDPAPAVEPSLSDYTAPAVQMTPGLKATPMLVGIGIAIIVLLAAILVALIVSGLNSGAPDATDPTAASDPAPAATSPADTGLNDETCKGSYTVSDDAAVAAKDTVIATLGDAKLTNGELQVYYWMEVSGFYSQYYSYVAYLGLDLSQGLDTQLCAMVETPMTWQQYFLACAINNWVNYQSLALDAQAVDFQLSDKAAEQLTNFDSSFLEEAISEGYESAELYIYDNLGAGADVQSFERYIRTIYTGGEYFDSLRANFTPTDAEVEAYLDANAETLAAQGITKENCTVDVRHILKMPEGATSETIRTEDFSEEAWAYSLAEAQKVMDLWDSGDKTEDSFAALANEYSDDNGGNVTNGGLYEAVAPGDMVTEFNDWCFDPQRQVGDCEIVKTVFGNHIMYFVGKTYTWPDEVRSYMLSEYSQEALQQSTAKYTPEVDYSAIQLGLAGFFQPVG